MHLASLMDEEHERLLDGRPGALQAESSPVVHHPPWRSPPDGHTGAAATGVAGAWRGSPFVAPAVMIERLLHPG